MTLTRAAAIVLVLLVLAVSDARAASAAPKVVATIAPVHSLVAGVMKGVGRPLLLLPPNASPHSYSLRPSQARALGEADLIFWVGESLESFLAKPIAGLGRPAAMVEMAEINGLTILKPREPDGGHEEDGHGHGGIDPHIWLDPGNARRMTAEIARRLAAADPANAAAYAANGEALDRRLAELERTLAARLVPLRGRTYFVFHDAYAYFEKRFGLGTATALTLGTDRQPGARRLSRLRQRIDREGIRCLFAEPGTPAATRRALSSGLSARVAVLDPLGTALPPGEDQYFSLMSALAEGLAGCLAGDG